MRGSYITLVVVVLLSLLGCAQPIVKPVSTGEETKLIYQCQSFWTEEEFSEICADKTKFKSAFSSELESLSRNYKISVDEFEFSFGEETHFTIAQCHIDGAISKSGGNYRGRFGWLLEPVGLDFINDNFEESKAGLSWRGTINSIPTTVEVECPPQDCVYKAWQEPVGHCHQHIWWPVSKTGLVNCIVIRGER